MNKAVVSLAMLKIYWDTTRRDYVENFVPFVVTLFNSKSYDRVKINVIRRDFQQLFGLNIPYHPMSAILDRARKLGFIERNKSGAFSPVREKIGEIDFLQVVVDQERKYGYVLEEFTKYCIGNFQETVTSEEAEQVFISFVREYDLDLLFLDVNLESVLPAVDATIPQKYMMYKFVHHTFTADPQIFQFILDFTIGHIFANALVYQNEETTTSQNTLANCKLYLDSGILFNITGVNGDDRQEAYTEFLEFLRQQGATLYVFRHTYEEFKGIIDGTLKWVENKRSYDPSRASRATIYFVDNDYSPSDVEQFIINIDRVLKQNVIAIVPPPDAMSDIIYQIDEATLKGTIIDIYKNRDWRFDEVDKTYTLDRDVKSVAGVYKLRKGVRPTSVSEVTHVFVTENSALAYACRRFEVSQQYDRLFFIPAVVTDVFLGTVTWLHFPAALKRMNEKRLIAACYAAFQPSRTMLKKLTQQADTLRTEGQISDEDFVLLNQSQVARNLLQEETLGDPERFTDQTAFDILRGIRNTIQMEAEASFGEERSRLSQESEILKASLERKDEEARREAERAVLAEQRIREQTEKNHRKASTIARISVWAIFIVPFAIFAGYTVFMQFLPDLPPTEGVLRVIMLIIAGVLGAASLIIGFNIKDTGSWLENLVRSFTLNWLES